MNWLEGARRALVISARHGTCVALLCGAWLAIPAAAQTPAAPDVDTRINQLTDEVRQLRELVLRLTGRIDELQAAAGAPAQATLATAATAVAGTAASSASPGAAPAPATTAASAVVPPAAEPADALRGITVNAMLDGYYAYNANRPLGRANYLRAYDVSSDSFSLNQADLLIESAPDVANGKRYGMRMDLQYGQATQTLQGSAANELRPDVYRNILQAYGTYVFPVGERSLQVDFGKWASSLGLEGNYTKDQINYSRSLWFDYLPFYHEGLRAAYQVNGALTLNYWITNGTQQTEAFNNYKDQLFGFTLAPSAALSWVFNYYVGQEHPDFEYLAAGSPGSQGLPTQQGVPFVPIANAPTGKLRIADTYATWQLSPALTLAAEADWVVDRVYSYSPGQFTVGGALYGRYQLSPAVAFAARAEYLDDRGGAFSGQVQRIREGTLTSEYRFVDGFLARAEFRRDAAGNPYFLSDTLGVLRTHQDTYTVGLVWWLGRKPGTW